MGDKIIIDTNQFKDVLASLEKDVKSIEDNFKNIENIMKIINEDDNTWKGKTGSLVNEKFQLLSSSFPNIITKLNNYNQYLKHVVNNYTQEENMINTSIDNNSDNLNVE